MWPLIAIAAAIGILAFSGSAKAATPGTAPLPPPLPPAPPGVVPVVFNPPGGAQPSPQPGQPPFVPAPGMQGIPLLTVMTNDPSPAGDLNVRTSPDTSSDANVIGTVPHRGLVRPDSAVQWVQPDGSLGPNDPTGVFGRGGWYHITDVGGIGSPPGVSGLASADFLSFP